MPSHNTPLRSTLDDAAESKGFYYDRAAAEKACRFFETFLCHSKGEWAGKPFTLQEWQRDLISKLFGWKRPDGTRRFRKAYVEIPKKNGKTTLAAGIALYLLVADGERGAEVYLSAVDKNQAGLCFKESRSMVEQSPSLRKAVEVVPYHKRLIFGKTNSFLSTLSADIKSKEGLNGSGIIIDELHAWQNPEMFNVLRYAGRARRQPLIAIITTAGYDRQSICYRERDYALKAERGEVEDYSVLCYVRCAEPTDDYQDPAVWFKANPSLGVTIPFESFEQEAREAFERPAELNQWLRYSLNVWTGAETAWMPPDKWDACNLGPIDWEALHGTPCIAGLDLSSVNDISALILLFGSEAAGYKVLRRFWVPGIQAEIRERRDKVPYGAWKREGLVTFTEKATVDYGAIRAEILRLNRLYPISKLLCDPWNATQLLQELQEEDIPVCEIRQGFQSLSPPTKELERLILEQRINHEGDEVLAWMASNAVAKCDDNGNYRLVKPTKDSPKKIDGMIALIESIAGELNDEGEERSKYEDEDLLVIG